MVVGVVSSDGSTTIVKHSKKKKTIKNEYAEDTEVFSPEEVEIMNMNINKLKKKHKKNKKKKDKKICKEVTGDEKSKDSEEEEHVIQDNLDKGKIEVFNGEEKGDEEKGNDFIMNEEEYDNDEENDNGFHKDQEEEYAQDNLEKGINEDEDEEEEHVIYHIQENQFIKHVEDIVTNHVEELAKEFTVYGEPKGDINISSKRHKEDTNIFISNKRRKEHSEENKVFNNEKEDEENNDEDKTSNEDINKVCDEEEKGDNFNKGDTEAFNNEEKGKEHEFNVYEKDTQEDVNVNKAVEQPRVDNNGDEGLRETKQDINIEINLGKEKESNINEEVINKDTPRNEDIQASTNKKKRNRNKKNKTAENIPKIDKNIPNVVNATNVVVNISWPKILVLAGSLIISGVAHDIISMYLGH